MVVKQEFRQKFLPKCVRWHALFVQIGNILSGRYGKDKEIEIEISVFLIVNRNHVFSTLDTLFRKGSNILL